MNEGHCESPGEVDVVAASRGGRRCQHTRFNPAACVGARPAYTRVRRRAAPGRQAHDNPHTRAISCTRMIYSTAARYPSSHVGARFGIRVGGLPCRLTNTVARSAVRRSSMPSISRNMKQRIRIVRSAEARTFSTYLHHLSRKPPERAEAGISFALRVWPLRPASRRPETARYRMFRTLDRSASGEAGVQRSTDGVPAIRTTSRMRLSA